MKRELKFRMWNPLPSKMIYELNVVMECLKQQLFHGSPDPLHIPKYDHEGEYGAVFMQFTGLHDKNGVEIYEGDIIRFTTTEGAVLTHRVWFNEELSCCMVGPVPYSKLYESGYIQPSKLVCEVIGNIYQNPELMNGKEAGKV